MGNGFQEVYRNAQGDFWSLLLDSSSGKRSMLHHANTLSGSYTAFIDVEQFIANAGKNPEHQELLRLIDGFVG